jgi:hypothetical protein
MVWVGSLWILHFPMRASGLLRGVAEFEVFRDSRFGMKYYERYKTGISGVGK